MKEWVIQSQHEYGDQPWSPWSVFWYEDGGPHSHWLEVCEQSATPFYVDEKAKKRYATGKLPGGFRNTTTHVYWARTLDDCIRIYTKAMSTRIGIVPFRFFNLRTGESFPTDIVAL